MIADLNRRFAVGLTQRNMDLLRRDSPETPFWYLNVFIGISGEALKMQYHLKRAFQERELNYLAWAARNLLELRVWALYATVSRKNAKRFHQDQYVDGLSVLRALERTGEKLPRVVDANFIKEVAAALRPEMEKHASAAGVDEKMPYLSPKLLAKQFNLEGEFEMYNVLCSKVLHSTGYSVLVGQDPDNKASVMDSLFWYAATCALGILDTLNARLKSESLPTYS